jgi:hypothetical protein
MAKIQHSSVHKLPSGTISYNESGTATTLAFLDFMYFFQQQKDTA